jgi:hypothetical protein
MRDIKLMKLNERGQASFGIHFDSIEGIDVLVQKVVSLLLSNTKETYFGSITGSNLLETGKYTFGDNGNADFKAQLSSDISLISKKIKAEEARLGIAEPDRLNSISIKDIVYEKATAKIYLSLVIATNAATKNVKIPIEQQFGNNGEQ